MAGNDMFLIARQRKAGTLVNHEVYPDDELADIMSEPDEGTAAIKELAGAIKALADRPSVQEFSVDTAPIAEVIKQQDQKGKKTWEFEIQRGLDGYLEKIIAREL